MRRFVLSVLAALPLLGGLVVLAVPTAPEPTYHPPLAEASDEAVKAIPRFRLVERLQAHAWAAEPLLAHPVAFAFDDQGRCYVAETFRHSDGVSDNRSHPEWLDDDIAARTVADRIAMYRKHLGDRFPEWEEEHDRVRMVWDSDGDGTADQASVFADGFHDIEDGIGSGVMARDGNVYYTCIPDLYLLRDEDGDGHAEHQESLSTGYGVHVTFIGHDLHGLCYGPDGRIYFSVGDRGLNVTTPEGAQLFNPDSGAVIRCEPDGSNLELVATGLRNPQELAFDAYGRLFTCDNNSDSGDRARWVHVVEGGDSGWRMYYQYPTSFGNRGPWNAEQIWHLAHPEQPGYVVPPCAHITDGPSGLCAYPGTGLADRYQDHFFLCDFRGASGQSGVWSLSVKPKGATFEPDDLHQFVWSILATDCDFGPDGAFYISDWVEGWNKTGKGRLYRFADQEQINAPAVQEMSTLLAEGFADRRNTELLALLDHADQRVRQRAQFELAKRGGDVVDSLADIAVKHENLLAQLHALWALGQITRQTPDLVAKVPVTQLLDDPNLDIRIQTLENFPISPEGLIARLADREPRVRLHAALAVGRLSPADANVYEAVRQMLLKNADQDAYLRHGGVMALAGLGGEWLTKAARDDSAVIRLPALLAMRRLHDPRISQFLTDVDPRLIAEAARAIHDESIGDLEPLANLIETRNLSEPLGYRVLNAHYRLGEPANAQVLAQFAARTGELESLRIEALRMLGDWASPGRRDRITGMAQSLPERSAEVASEALRPVLGAIFSGPRRMRGEAARITGRLGIREIGPELFALLDDADQSPDLRVQALEALETLQDSRLTQAVETALGSDEPLLRNAGRAVLAKSDPARVIRELGTVLAQDNTPLREKQGAYTLLANIGKPEADRLIGAGFHQYAEGTLPPELHLDVLEAVRQRSEATPDLKNDWQAYQESLPAEDPLAPFRPALQGGDAEAGRAIFLGKVETYCLRCHKVEGTGGEVGPALDGIGAKHPRPYLLEALITPDKAIAEGYDSVVLYLFDGTIARGVLREEDDTEVRIVTPEGQLLRIAKEDIDDRQKDRSAMPEDLVKHLSVREVRDLVEFLSGLKQQP